MSYISHNSYMDGNQRILSVIQLLVFEKNDLVILHGISQVDSLEWWAFLFFTLYPLSGFFWVVMNLSIFVSVCLCSLLSYSQKNKTQNSWRVINEPISAVHLIIFPERDERIRIIVFWFALLIYAWIIKLCLVFFSF